MNRYFATALLFVALSVNSEDIVKSYDNIVENTKNDSKSMEFKAARDVVNCVFGRIIMREKDEQQNSEYLNYATELIGKNEVLKILDRNTKSTKLMQSLGENPAITAKWMIETYCSNAESVIGTLKERNYIENIKKLVEHGI